MSGVNWQPTIDALAKAAEAQERARERNEERRSAFFQEGQYREQTPISDLDPKWQDFEFEIQRMVEQGMTMRAAALDALAKRGIDAGDLERYVLVEERLKDGRLRWYYQLRADAQPPVREPATLATATLGSESAAVSQEQRSSNLLHFIRWAEPRWPEPYAQHLVAEYLEEYPE